MSGVSDSENKELAVKWIKELKPKTVLDIGCGMGIYNILSKVKGQHWTGLEAFAPYIEMFNLYSRYEEIIIADARYVNYDKVGDFDLSITADVLEHMFKHEAKQLIIDLLEHSKYLLISIPVEHQEQQAGYENNKFETHIDHWTYEEMKEFLKGKEITHEVKGNVLAYFMVKGYN